MDILGRFDLNSEKLFLIKIRMYVFDFYILGLICNRPDANVHSLKLNVPDRNLHAS